jgi:hypothetical protein
MGGARDVPQRLAADRLFTPGTERPFPAGPATWWLDVAAMRLAAGTTGCGNLGKCCCCPPRAAIRATRWTARANPTPLQPRVARGLHNLTSVPRFTRPGSRLKFLPLTFSNADLFRGSARPARKVLSIQMPLREPRGDDVAGVNGPKRPAKIGSFPTITQHPTPFALPRRPGPQTSGAIARFHQSSRSENFSATLGVAQVNRAAQVSRIACPAMRQVTILDYAGGGSRRHSPNANT